MTASTADHAAAEEPSGVEEPAGTQLTREVVFETLSCRRRRHALHYLREQERVVDLRELSTHVAAWESEVAPEAVTYDQRMRVYTALRQAHLPKMDENGIVEFDPARGEVTLTRDASKLDVYLDVVPHDELPWSRFYVGLAAISGLFVLGAWAGTFPLSSLSGYGVAAIVVATFGVSALAHRRHADRMRLGGDDPPSV